MPRKACTDHDELIIDLYADGDFMTMNQISESIGKSADFVRSRLRAHDIEIASNRSGGRRIPYDEVRRTRFLFERMGMNPNEIAVVLGKHPCTIRRRINKMAGLKLRNTINSPFAKEGGSIEPSSSPQT